jgi:hypothetical protein
LEQTSGRERAIIAILTDKGRTSLAFPIGSFQGLSALEIQSSPLLLDPQQPKSWYPGNLKLTRCRKTFFFATGVAEG